MSNEIDTVDNIALIETDDSADITDIKDTTGIKDLTNEIKEVRLIAEHLYNLLHEDALHRLDLYKKYTYENDATRWSPDLYKRCQLIEALCRKLDTLIA